MYLLSTFWLGIGTVDQKGYQSKRVSNYCDDWFIRYFYCCRYWSENTERKMFSERSNMWRMCVWVGLFASCWGQRAEQLLAQNPCSSKTTCSECVRTASCAWCFAPEFNGPRCFNPAMEGGTGGCDEAYMYNPDNELAIDPLYNRDLSRGKVDQLNLTLDLNLLM